MPASERRRWTRAEVTALIDANPQPDVFVVPPDEATRVRVEMPHACCDAQSK